MNREIKFRVWCNVYKEMKTVEQLGFGGRATIVSGKSFEDIAPVVDYELMQFTGLYDKNGKEVYEGDIVNCSSGCPHEVVWMREAPNENFGGMPGFYLSGLRAGYSWTGGEEIVGNKYENPELLSPK